MNNLTKWESRKWNPFREMEDLHHQVLASLFGGSLGRRNGDNEDLGMTGWSPLVDIVEDQNEYVISADLPEVRKDDLKITIENGVLTLTGERKFEKEEKGKKYHRVERAYGSFVRSFSLPGNVDASKVNAEFKDGVLRVHVAKDERARPRNIDVKIS